MKTYVVRLRPSAEFDLQAIDDWVASSESEAAATTYLARIRTHLAGFELAPARGTRLRGGRRRVGFERRVTILFRIRGDEVLILRVFARGRRAPVE